MTGRSARDNFTLIAPCSHLDSIHATATGRKEQRVPAEEPLRGQKLSITLGSVKDHFTTPSTSLEGTGIALRPSRGDGRQTTVPAPDRVSPLNLARLYGIEGEGLKSSFVAEGETQALHPSDQLPCLYRTPASFRAIVSESQRKRGQSGNS